MKRKLLFLSVITGVLLSAGFYPFGSGIIMLIGFLPLLFVEDYFYEHKKEYRPVKVFWYSGLAFATWNLLTMWWVYNASPAGIIAIPAISGVLMGAVFMAFHIVRRNLGNSFGYFSLILFWLSFEHLYLKAEISNPWLTLGYGFQNDHRIIQWYEFTGALGGSLWILLVNVLVFRAYKYYLVENTIFPIRRTLTLILIPVILAPIILSLVMYNQYEEKKDPYEIVVVQPNIDPYLKFNDIPSLEQTQRLIDLADSLADEDTDYIVAPETCINNNIWVHQLHRSADLQIISQFLKDYPQAKFVLGITAYERYQNGKRSATARELGSSGVYFDSFNSAIQLDSTKNIPIYHKSQLVVGVEKMPYPGLLSFLKPLTLQLGGTFRSHGSQEKRANFYSPQDSLGVSPVICWESVYGEYVSDYIKKGSGFIFIITNDGWWGNTPGHVQHNALARIRAIETRRSIARSANTGISSFVNQRGDMLQKLNWWKRGALKTVLNANDEITFYVKHGNYIARIALFFSLLMVLYVVAKILQNRKGKGVY
ncbi:MAG: apolipoprotein N-acyltransferase [Bacteroidetes bacterium]|jgi:apolipoprotein N-acyltransferase|nr:apolipoprotein N-acyltransferase [Bacteroidota bacterium]